MILITGGAFQGKSELAVKLANGEMQIIDNLEILIKQWLAAGEDPYARVNELVADNVIFVVKELGCGVVPLDADDRNWREITGRISCALAASADEVYRCICGIADRIK